MAWSCSQCPFHKWAMSLELLWSLTSSILVIGQVISLTYPSHYNPESISDFMSAPRIQPSLFPSRIRIQHSLSSEFACEICSPLQLVAFLYLLTSDPSAYCLSFGLLLEEFHSWSAHPSDLLHCLLSWGGFLQCALLYILSLLAFLPWVAHMLTRNLNRWECGLYIETLLVKVEKKEVPG